MAKTRTEALRKLLNELEEFEINPNIYYGDAEPQGVYDNVLSGKISSLLAFCRKLGWSDLATLMQGMIPIQGNAIEILEQIKSFVIPEARRLMTVTDIEASAGPVQWFWQFIHPRVCEGCPTPAFAGWDRC